MKVEEELQILNNLYKNIYGHLTSKDTRSNQLFKALNELQFEPGFVRQCLKTKLQIFKLLIIRKQELKDSQLKQVCEKLKIFGLSNTYLEEEGLINMYIDLHQLNHQSKHKENYRMHQFTNDLLKSLEQLIKFFFLKNELKHYRKCKNMLPIGIHEQLQGQIQAMQQKIKQRVWTKSCSELFKQYLKSQQANDQKQLCRVCYKQINISDLVKHVNHCGKRTYLKEQLTENFSRRLTILLELQHFLDQGKQSKDAKAHEVVQKIVQFYKFLIKDKTGCKKMTVRCQDKNLSLFIESQQAKTEKQPIIQLISELYALQNKAFCLSKKLQEVESELNVTVDIKVQANILKMSLDPSFKKYQFMSQNNGSQAKENIRAQKKTNNQVENKIFEQLSQESAEQFEVPIIKKRWMRKKMSVSDRQNMSDQSDSNASQKNLRQINVNNFQILKLLGKGAFGRVYLVRRKKTRDIYALKAIRIDKNWGEHELESIKNEYGIYKKIEGDHLVAATFSFNQKNVQFFVLQYMPGGDLSKILEQNIYLQQKDATFYLAQILLAIEHLHKADIVHRDLKPENVVLDAKGHLKLTDFGLSQCRVRNKIQKVLGNQKVQQKQMSLKTSSTKKSILKNKNGKKLIGTPDYIAPEIIQGRSLTNPTIDWWSFGVIAYELLIGCRPFSANSIQQILNNIQLGEIQWPEIGYQDQMISPVAVDFIKKLLKKNFEQRLGFNGVQQIKKHQFFKDIDWENLKNSSPPLLSSAVSIENIEFLADDRNLRRQIQILMESQLENPLQQLRNYVRYDLLTAQTLESIKSGEIKKQKRRTKLKSIAINLQRKQSPVKIEYKPAFSSQEQQI